MSDIPTGVIGEVGLDVAMVGAPAAKDVVGKVPEKVGEWVDKIEKNDYFREIAGKMGEAQYLHGWVSSIGGERDSFDNLISKLMGGGHLDRTWMLQGNNNDMKAATALVVMREWDEAKKVEVPADRALEAGIGRYMAALAVLRGDGLRESEQRGELAEKFKEGFRYMHGGVTVDPAVDNLELVRFLMDRKDLWNGRAANDRMVGAIQLWAEGPTDKGFWSENKNREWHSRLTGTGKGYKDEFDSKRAVLCKGILEAVFLKPTPVVETKGV